jgi:hypothetical protein
LRKRAGAFGNLAECHGRPDQPPLERCRFAYLLRWTDGMICKTDKIRSAWAAGDRIGPLRVAARFFDRSEDTMIFKRGMDAHNHPDFYRQLGKEPEQIIQDALEILADRFCLPFPITTSKKSSAI